MQDSIPQHSAGVLRDADVAIDCDHERLISGAFVLYSPCLVARDLTCIVRKVSVSASAEKNIA